MAPDDQRKGSLQCPLCSRGTLIDIVFDLEPGVSEQIQRPDSREMLLFSCGHRVAGDALDSADADRLDVERRQSEETVDPGAADG